MLFITHSEKPAMVSSNVADQLTSTFNRANIFQRGENSRVCCTRIRVGLASFAINDAGIDQGYFAKHFMKNREQTTALYYNVLANQRES